VCRVSSDCLCLAENLGMLLGISPMFLLLISFYFQRPRVCILGGGFGGLYTALRLESLVWPDNNKPQVKL
jgi:hypothetical protein